MARVLDSAGRFLQVVGLILLPLGIAGNLSPREPLTLGQSLGMAGVGVLVFMVGHYLRQIGKPSE
jgi:hypothetical protein